MFLKNMYDEIFLTNKSVYFHGVILTVMFLNSHPYRDRRKFARKSLAEESYPYFFSFYFLFFFFCIFQLVLAVGFFINGGEGYQNGQFLKIRMS